MSKLMRCRRFAPWFTVLMTLVVVARFARSQHPASAPATTLPSGSAKVELVILGPDLKPVADRNVTLGESKSWPDRGWEVIRKAGADQPESIDKENAFPLAAGDVVCVETGGGGGYGPPAGRRLQLIERDIAAGYISVAAAENDYGVKIGRDGKAHR